MYSIRNIVFVKTIYVYILLIYEFQVYAYVTSSTAIVYSVIFKTSNIWCGSVGCWQLASLVPWSGRRRGEFTSNSDLGQVSGGNDPCAPETGSKIVRVDETLDYVIPY